MVQPDRAIRRPLPARGWGVTVPPLDRYPERVVKDEWTNRTLVLANDGTVWEWREVKPWSWCGSGWKQLPSLPGGRRITGPATGFPFGWAWWADDKTIWKLWYSSDNGDDQWTQVPSMPQPQKKRGAR